MGGWVHCRSEYQKSYRVSRSRSVSPQRCAPLAGLRSDQMRICREPGLQRRKRLDPGGLTLSCTSLPCASDPQRPLAAPTAHTHNKVPSNAPRSRSAHRKDPSPKPPTPPESPAEPEPPERCSANSGSSGEPGATGKSTKLHPSQLHSQSQARRPLSAAPDGRQPSANEVEQALRWRAGLRSAGQRSGGHRTEYHRQFSWKKPVTSASPILTAEQVLYSSSRSIPPFKKNPVSMETEYQQNFQGVAPPTGPPLLKHLEHQRIPLFHTYTSNKKRREESQKMLRPKRNDPASQEDDIRTPPPPQVPGGHRIPEEGGAMDGDTPQVTELRQRAASYRSRAWGTNFCRDHLSQLQSEHNALWEPTDSSTDPPTPRLTSDLGQEPDSRSTSCVEALDLASRSCDSSQRSSVVGSAETHNTNKNTKTNAHTPPAERRTAWKEEEDEEESEDEDEGRLPTPRLKMRPVQRTHHDLTTPATGGAILVGTVKSSDLNKQRCGSVVSVAAALDMPIRQMEAWSEKSRPHRPSPGPSPDPKPASKPIRTKQTPPPTVAPPLQLPPALHCIQGTLRHPDFQHNGELGSRFMELQSPGADEDDRLSVMSWRSAASCSAASVVLERAQKRRESFWGKR
ncbi:nuclear protein MDM1 isoform X3 [Hippoglossus stenolepis]|uniref:nuclear protein MDM1 isoform X3 n=1 Tax=Hippoglossus stenolepis TaxID=195615 RepID=UPI001FB03C6D|nr:nuclear protein MDM1 isoform X3 [Hippoglossus stenolepis]